MPKPVTSARFTSGNYKLQSSDSVKVVVGRDALRIQHELKIEQLEKALQESAIAAEQGIENALHEGFKAGYEKGQNDGKAEVIPARDRLFDLVTELENGIDKVWDDSREALITLTLDISRKIVGKVAEDYVELTRGLTGRAMKLIRDQLKVVAVVNPEDAAMLRAAQADMLGITEGIKSFEVLERSNIERGGVLLETNAGQLDARLEEQMSAFVATLQPSWEESDHEDD